MASLTLFSLIWIALCSICSNQDNRLTLWRSPETLYRSEKPALSRMSLTCEAPPADGQLGDWEAEREAEERTLRTHRLVLYKQEICRWLMIQNPTRPGPQHCNTAAGDQVRLFGTLTFSPDIWVRQSSFVCQNIVFDFSCFSDCVLDVQSLEWRSEE